MRLAPFAVDRAAKVLRQRMAVNLRKIRAGLRAERPLLKAKPHANQPPSTRTPRPVYCATTNQSYESLSAAARMIYAATGVSVRDAQVREAAKRKGSVCGYEFSFVTRAGVGVGEGR